MKNLTLICLIINTVIYIGCGGYSKSGDDGSPYTTGGYYEDPIATGETYNEITENPFVSTSEETKSTFSIDADGAAYANARRFIMKYDRKPPIDAIRTEELINYFHFDYPQGNDLITLNSETSFCPWTTGHLLMRVGLKGKELDELPPSNFVFLIDVSGSMSSEDKLTLLKEGLLNYVDLIQPTSKISIVTYAGNAGVLIDGGSGNDKAEIKAAIQNLGAGGFTAGAQGIITAYEIAQKHFIHGGNNRIILGTDGDFNVGASSQEELIERVESKRDEGVYLTVLGLGTGNLNEGTMEQIANNGNGNFEYLDSSDELIKVFVHDYQKFFTIAKDVKIQVHFDSSKVDAYRLIGYENRKLNNEDFEDEQKDAGELGSDQTVTAVYEIIPREGLVADDQLASLSLNYKDANTTSTFDQSTTITYQNQTFSQSSESMRFAASVIGFGLLLRDSPYKGDVTWNDVISWGEDAISHNPHELKSGYLDMLYTVREMD